MITLQKGNITLLWVIKHFHHSLSDLSTKRKTILCWFTKRFRRYIKPFHNSLHDHSVKKETIFFGGLLSTVATLFGDSCKAFPTILATLFRRFSKRVHDSLYDHPTIIRWSFAKRFHELSAQYSLVGYKPHSSLSS
jgi:hypothetical protein